MPKPTRDAEEVLTDRELEDLATATARLTYGGRGMASESVPTEPEFVPAYVAFDKKVLSFNAYMKQTVHESPLEQFRVR